MLDLFRETKKFLAGGSRNRHDRATCGSQPRSLQISRCILALGCVLAVLCLLTQAHQQNHRRRIGTSRSQSLSVPADRRADEIQPKLLDCLKAMILGFAQPTSDYPDDARINKLIEDYPVEFVDGIEITDVSEEANGFYHSHPHLNDPEVDHGTFTMGGKHFPIVCRDVAPIYYQKGRFDQDEHVYLVYMIRLGTSTTVKRKWKIARINTKKFHRYGLDDTVVEEITDTINQTNARWPDWSPPKGHSWVIM